MPGLTRYVIASALLAPLAGSPPAGGDGPPTTPRGAPTAWASIQPLSISDQVVRRGADFAPPDQVKGVVLKRLGDELEISWQRCRDSDSAYYRVYVDRRQVGETEGLSLQLWAGTAIDRPLTVVAHDRQGNAS